MNKISILGSGTSTGVPILGCKCRICQSNDPRNKRLRASILLETKNSKSILVDTSPDLRAQLLSSKTTTIDAAIITHDHADHTHGIDDLRPFSFRTQTPIPVFSDSETCDSLTTKFPYIFQRNKPILGGGIPLLNLHPISEGAHDILDEIFNFYFLPHGHGSSLCFIHEKFGYIVDCREIPPHVLKSFTQAKLDLLVIDCLRYEPHQTHLHLDLTLKYIEAIRPKKAILTHMGHEIGYSDITNQLISLGYNSIFPAIDGQTFLYS